MMAHRFLEIFIVMIVSLTGCGLLNNVSNTTPAAPASSSSNVPADSAELLVADTIETSNQSLSVNDVINATVRIGMLDASWQEVGHGSGSIIDARGLILTNYHVIGDNERGQFYNADGI